MVLFTVLGVAVVGAGCYLYFYSKSTPPSPGLPNRLQESQLQPTVILPPEAAPSAAYTEISGQIVVPQFLQADWPNPASILAIVREVGGPGFPNQSILEEKSYDPKTMKFHFLTQIKENSTYVLDFLVCKQSANQPCNNNFQDFAMKMVFEVGKSRPKKLDVGNLYAAHHLVRTSNCDLSQPFLSGVILPTKSFPRQPAPGKKFVFFGVNWRPLPGEGTAYHFDKGPSPFANGKKIVGLTRALFPPIYSEDIELKPEGVHFTIPSLGYDPGVGVIFYITECDAKLTPSACQEKIQLFPSNARAIPGYLYRLAPEHLSTPTCGAKNFKLFLHSFSPPGSPFSIPHQTDPSIPEEIMEGMDF
ncbi:MAG: hypothetical protein ACXVB9_00760 [Bdellovibrionota bacterium]